MLCSKILPQVAELLVPLSLSYTIPCIHGAVFLLEQTLGNTLTHPKGSLK